MTIDGIAEAREEDDGTWSLLVELSDVGGVETVRGLPSKNIADKLVELISAAFDAGGEGYHNVDG